jgi:formate C-acetyltransferase
MLLNEAPKYGVNDAEADAVAREVALLHYNQLRDKRTAHGGRYAQLLFTNTLMSVLGSALRTAATPDGRRNGDPIGISVSPTPSKDVAGPLAAMKSVCALDHSSVPGGMSYIMELNTEHIRDDDGEISVDMLADLIQAYVDMGGMNLAINVLDPEWLIEAKHEPEKWPHLSARYYGWSGYYNNLDSRLKDFLIARSTRDKVES